MSHVGRLALVVFIVFSTQALSWCPVQAAPISKLTQLPVTDVPLANWTVGGDGRAAEATAGFVQEGRKPFGARTPLTAGGNFRLTGEVLLPLNASLSIDLLTENEAGDHFSTKLTRSKYALRWDRQDIPQPNTDPATTWTPFVAERLNGVLHLIEGGYERIGVSPGGNALALTLQNGARLRQLKLSTAGALPQLLIPAFLDGLANVSLTDPAAKLLGDTAVAAVGRPRGLMVADGTPFDIVRDDAKHALDIAPSMTGWDDREIRSVKAYLTPTAGYPSSNGKTSREALKRIVFTVPASNYSAIHLLAFARDGAGMVPRVTVRLGRFGSAHGILESKVAQIPLWHGAGEAGNPDVVSRIPTKLANGATGYLYHLRVPLENAGNLTSLVAQGKGTPTFDVELTRDVRTRVPVPDPFEFGELPAGPPSGAVVLAATMERSPITLHSTTAEPGNIFNDNQRVVFECRLNNVTDRPLTGRLLARAAVADAERNAATKERQAEARFSLQPGETRLLPLDLTPGRRGWFTASLEIETGGQVLQRRTTSFAVIAPDTRQALDDSPFGVWCFWDAHTTTNDADRIEKLAAIIHKGGWRWTYGGDPTRRAPEAEATAILKNLKTKYKFQQTLFSLPQSHQNKEGWFDEDGFAKQVAPTLALAVRVGYDPFFKVLHESRSSTSLIRRYSEYIGGAPYVMPDVEKEQLEKQVANTKQYAAALKRSDRTAKVVLFNDYPAVVAEFLKRGFPSESFDVIGTEGANFMRQPERQPDWMCLLGTLTQLRRMQKQYGYDKPIWTTEALYHATTPGNLSLHAQGVIAVREAMLALANGVQRMAAAGIVADSSDDYYWSNWGGAGFCFRDPEYSPKPSFAMYAWLTQVLDQTRYKAFLATGSTVLHVLDFQKPSGDHIYPVWTVRGRQRVTLQVQGGVPVVYDVYGNTIATRVQNQRIELDATDAPLYITGVTITAVIAHAPREIESPSGQVLFKFGNSAQLKPVTMPSTVLQGMWSTPYLKGDFVTSQVQQDGTGAMRLELQGDADNRKLLPRYIELALAQPLTITTARPAAVTLRLKGNGGWGRIMFECEDAAGRTWTSCGNQLPGASNSEDSEGVSFINFDGWGTITVPLPGQYPGGDQFIHWPRNFNWWPTGAPVDAALALATQLAQAAGTKTMPVASRHDEVSYPLKLTKVIVAMRPSILYVNDEIPLTKPVIYLDRLGVLPAPAGM